MAKPPFSNSMEADNEPTDGSPNAGANDNDTRGIGSKERTTYQNAGVDTPAAPGYPLPPDPHAPPGPDAKDRSDSEISDFGLNEKVEVGHNSSQTQYGITE